MRGPITWTALSSQHGPDHLGFLVQCALIAPGLCFFKNSLQVLGTMFNDDLLFLEKVSSSSTWSGTRRGRERAEVSSLSPSHSLTLTLSLLSLSPFRLLLLEKERRMVCHTVEGEEETEGGRGGSLSPSHSLILSLSSRLSLSLSPSHSPLPPAPPAPSLLLPLPLLPASPSGWPLRGAGQSRPPAAAPLWRIPTAAAS